MPKKTHLRRGQVQALLEARRGAIAQRRMQTTPVIVLLEKLSHVEFYISTVAVLASIDFLLLKGFDEALAHRIVVRTAGAAHAGLDAVLLQHSDVLPRGVLGAPIGMVHQADPRLAFGNRL